MDSFDSGTWQNMLNAGSGLWNANGASVQAVFADSATVVYGGTGKSLKLSYDIPATEGEHAGYWTGLYTRPDMRLYSDISFMVKGTSGGESFKVGLKDSGLFETKLPVTDYLANGVTTYWQKVTIPVADFAGVNASLLDNFSITFENTSGAGAIYIDELRFLKWDNIAGNLPNSGICPVKTAGMPNTGRNLVRVEAEDTSNRTNFAESRDYFTVAANLAAGKPAAASSWPEGAAFAVDSDTGTRWSSDAADPQWYQVDLGTIQPVNQVVLNWETAYGKAYTLDVSTDGASWAVVFSTTNSAGGIQNIEFNAVNARFVRMSGTERGTQWGYSLWEFGVYFNIHKSAVYASSDIPPELAARNAFDADINTRWSSYATDSEWITVDFGAPLTFSKVTLYWETAYGRSYDVEVSDDGINWETVYTRDDGTGGTETLDTGIQTSSYLRIRGIQRGTERGYSIWEIAVE